jgi:DNA topoisomerase II
MSKNEKTIEEQYKKRELHQSILKDPGMYIGPTESDTLDIYYYDDKTESILKGEKNIVLGLYKIIDEILVNAADNTVRNNKKCNLIKVNVDKELGTISVYNNGCEIPIAIHKEYNIYVPELLFGNLLTSSNYDEKDKLVGGKHGYGSKCIEKSTLVPLYDGSIKIASEITLTDKLIGDDGNIRNINNIIKGNGQIYEIIQEFGNSYKVNDQHILTLYMKDHKKIFWNNNKNCWSVMWWNDNEKCINEKSIIIFDGENNIELEQKRKELNNFCNTILNSDTFDISIQDYMKLDDNTKNRLSGKRSQCVNWNNKKVNIDAYTLGLWLGNELSDNNDIEHNLLKEYDLINNKHIPKDYIINDRETRLNIIAGIIDNNGNLSKDEKTIEILQKITNKKLIDDIIFLAQSLGFYCTVEKEEDDYYKLNISGNMQDIPTRENVYINEINNCVKSTGKITINDIGTGDYIGIEIDHNQRFIINDFTVTHNCSNIYSKEFSIEITDTKRKKRYFQQFSNNMFNKEEPIITDLEDKCDAYIKTTFLPDYKRFGINKLTKDMYQIIKRRVYDIAATTNKKMKVYFNDEEIKINTFRNYIDLFYKNSDKKVLYKEFNDRWAVGIVYDPDCQFDHMTFVNNINTFKGGTHLNYIVKQIVDKVTDKVKAKDKKNNIKVKPSQIKDNITVFINCLIEDPDFPSQAKETMAKNASKFKVKCEIDQKFIDELCKTTGIVDDIFEISKVRHENELGKTDGKKKTNINKIEKLRDANFAGTDKSSKCILILCEGDSAMNSAVAGLEVIGNDYYGALPLKGKLLNVKKSITQKVLDNEEFAQIKEILGLKHGVVYTDTKSLRYGSVMLCTDQDVDGYHIKGLFMNYIHTYWPSLLQIDGFIKCLATQIVKVFKASDPKKEVALETFFTQTEFKKWRDTISSDDLHKYYIKYYKGLGTSTVEEARDSFDDFENKLINYVWDDLNFSGKNNDSNDNNDDDEVKSNVSSVKEKKKGKYTIEGKNKSDASLIIAFADSFEDDRKKLVKNYNKDIIIENSQKRITYSEYVEKELVHYSHYNVMRSVPNISDGFKPSQRKILYGTLLRKLEKTETKVSQLAGFISDKAGYHHGETSLQEATIGMAQNFVGSSNINLLYPSGMFGTRILGGKDHASPRYIFTKNAELLKYIFPSEDDPILEHIDEDNDTVEPHVYYPIIPMILVNGSSGIGTGYSSNIPLYDPRVLIENIKIYLDYHLKYDDTKIVSKFKELIPWYRGFTGKIEKIDNYTYKTYGCYETINENQVRITELPIGKWTQDYINYIISLIKDDTLIADYKLNPTIYKVDIIITFKNNILQALIKSNTLMNELKLVTTLKTSNMHLCKTINNEDNTKTIKIQKYDNVNEILIDYIKLRYDGYIKRKKYYIAVLENEMAILENRKRFIEYLCPDIKTGVKKLNIERKSKEYIINMLIDHKFTKLALNINSDKSYDYLTGLPIFSLSEDKIIEHQEQINKKTAELITYKNTSIEDLWINDLNKFEKNYDKFYDEFIDRINAKHKGKVSSSTKKVKSSLKKTKK